MTLSIMQSRFMEALSGEKNSALDKALDTAHISAEGLIGIYRNNFRGGLTKALVLTHPVVEQLVGEDFFRAVCQDYIRKHLPQETNLDAYGTEFATFLETFEPAKTVPFLPDVARLEWAFHEASQAPAARTLDVAAFETIDPERYFELRLILHPSVRLLTSRYPVLRIWEMHQEGQQVTPVNLDESAGIKVLLQRPDLQVIMTELQSAEYIWLESLMQGSGFFAAFEAASASDEAFDLASVMQKHVVLGTFSGFHTT